MPQQNTLNKLSFPLVAGVFAFTFYFSCLSPTVTYGGDCGELIAASWTGGIPHPTGYSLYAMLGWIFSHLLVIGEVAWRYNLLSALLGSLAVLLVAATVQRITQQRLAALVAALSLAGCYFFASQSVIAEVYALNGALIALLFYAAIRWKLDHQWCWLALLAFGIGLIPNTHLSSIYLLPGIIVFLWPRSAKVLLQGHSKKIIGLALLVILGFSFTLYLPWRARQFPQPATGPGGTLIYQPGDWGHPATLKSWWNHATAKQYRSLLWDNHKVEIGGAQFTIPVFTQPISEAGEKMTGWLGNVALQYLWLIIFTIIGAIACWKLAPRLGWLLWLPFAFNLFFQSNYKVTGVADIANFLFPCYIVMAIWTGIGYHAVSKVLLRWKPEKQNLARLALQAITIAAIVIQWVTVYPAINHRHDTRARDTALQRADAVRKFQDQTGKTASVLMWNDDTLFPFWYAQRVLEKVPNTQTPWGPIRHYYWDRGHKMDFVNQLQKNNPLLVAEWDPQINAAFPFIPLNQSGTLWLASHRKLPEPAKVLLGSKSEMQELHLPTNIKTGELFAATLDFTFNPAGHKIIKRDRANRTVQVGWVEIGYKKYDPKPKEGLHPWNSFNQNEISQRIPIVISDTIKNIVRLQMILPLQVPRTFPESACDIWFRPTDGVWQRLWGVPIIH
jgi:4-amino-4-deoxy-L-arabinose transferase-like glycosyltransferase